MGPNITDWPKMYPLTEDLLVKLGCRAFTTRSPPPMS